MRCAHCPVEGPRCVGEPAPMICGYVRTDPAAWVPVVVEQSAMPIPETPAATEPGFIAKAAGFASAVAHHVAAGCPKVSDDERERRLAICRACPHHDDLLRTCKICGCGLGLKASWALSQCPDNPPRWTADPATFSGETTP